MMMAWKVSGLSHRPAIIASRPASMRLAIAISPSRESSSTEPISRRYMRTGSSVRSVGSLVSALAGTFCWTSTNSPLSLSASSSASSRGSSSSSLGSAPSLLVSWVSTKLTPIARNITSTSSICSELTSSEGNTELIWSWVSFLAERMSFLIAASDRSSGRVSGPSFSGISSFCGVSSVLLAMSLTAGTESRWIAVLSRSR
jgi:hypothetical protein